MKTSVVVVATILLVSPFFAVTSAAQNNTQKSQYFMDVHRLEPGSVKYGDVAGAHEKDLMTQDKYGVQFITYWVDEPGGVVYCLSKAKDDADVEATHREAHGLIPAEIYEVAAGEEASYTGNGSLFLDIHDLGPGNVTSAAVAEAHLKDLKEQGSRNVNFINYWVDEKNGKVFCLAEAPDKDAVIATHKHAHGLVPVEVVLVKQGQ